MSDKKIRLRMNVSIASPDWSHQPGEVFDEPADTAAKWIRSGLATAVPKDTPLSSANDLLADLSVEECRQRRCTHCDRRASYVLRNFAYCARHFRSALEA
jgi:hypothetical protein